MISLEEFQQNLASIQARIAAACESSGRAVESVQLLPVTKNHPVDAVQFAFDAGLRSVGENRVQETLQKQSQTTLDVTWVLIGHLQSNKAKDAVRAFDMIQSVDSTKLLKRLARHAEELDKKLSVLLQCNSGEDPNKSGFRIDELKPALEVALGFDRLEVDGLMTIAPLGGDLTVAKAAFDKLREARDELQVEYDCELPELSMGMTNDLEQAIAAGATQIRIGTALYGQRVY